MAQSPAPLDLDDAINFIVLFLKDPAVSRPVVSYGDRGYDVFVAKLSRAYRSLHVDDQLELGGCSTGESTGWAPLRILSTEPAVRRKVAARSSP